LCLSVGILSSPSPTPNLVVAGMFPVCNFSGFCTWFPSMSLYYLLFLIPFTQNSVSSLSKTLCFINSHSSGKKSVWALTSRMAITHLTTVSVFTVSKELRFNVVRICCW
jgi:hypothetical protein